MGFWRDWGSQMAKLDIWGGWTIVFLLFYFLLGQENGQTDSTSSVVKQGHHHFWWKLFFYSYTDRSTEVGMSGGRGVVWMSGLVGLVSAFNSLSVY
jgi:hypothetical protein